MSLLYLASWKHLLLGLTYGYSWSESHPKIWLSIAVVQSKVVKYSQFHVDHNTSQALKAAGLPIAEYDGGVNIWAASNDDLMSVRCSCSY